MKINKKKMIEFLARDLRKEEIYSLLTQSIFPRPIGFISSSSKKGINNLAPFSFFNAICSFPAYFSVSVSINKAGKLKDTARNLLERKEAVFNLVSYDLVEKMNLTSKDFAYEVDEFERAQLTPTPSTTIKVNRVKEALIALEGKVKKALLMGKTIQEINLTNKKKAGLNLAQLEKQKLIPSNAVIFFCQVTNFIFQKELIDPKNLIVNQAKINAVARCGRNFYVHASNKNTFTLTRPK